VIMLMGLPTVQSGFARLLEDALMLVRALSGGA
jgi:hypothetical protein